MSNQIKKEDRAYLYFRENAKGSLNIKFGPDKFGTDTEKFVQILLTGNLHCLTFLSNLTRQEPLDFRTRQYENMKLNYHAALDQAFDDVFAEKKRIYELEELAIERVNSGDTVSPEFEEKVKEAKETIKSRSTQKTTEKTEAKQEVFKKEIEDRIQLLEEIKEQFISKHEEGLEDVEHEDNDMATIMLNLLKDEIEKLTKLYGDVEQGNAFIL